MFVIVLSLGLPFFFLQITFGYQRPLDVSMDSSRLYALLTEVPFTPISAAVAEVLTGKGKL